MKKITLNIGTACMFLLIVVAVSGQAENTAFKEIDRIRAMLEDWRKAWESKDIDRFMTFYSPRFESNGLDYNAWKARKERLFDIRGKIDIKLIDPWVLVEGNRASVRFIQRYQGPTEIDNGEKTMDLYRSAETWLILSERWQSLPSPAPLPDRDEPTIPNQSTVELQPSHHANISADSTKHDKSRYLVGSGDGAEHVYYYSEPGSEGVSIEFSSFAIPRFFTLEGDRPRIVIDVKDVSNWQGPPKTPINGRQIRQIRSFLHHRERRLRIVLDMYPNRNYMIDQIYDIDRHIYIISVEGVN